MANHVAAIHVLKAQLSLPEADYRALLYGLTGKDSCSGMSDREQATVRAHMDQMAERADVARGGKRRPMTKEQFTQAKRQASPKERKVWALWHALHRVGRVQNTSASSLNAWVARQVGVSALRFANDAQLDALIEALKRWVDRRPA